MAPVNHGQGHQQRAALTVTSTAKPQRSIPQSVQTTRRQSVAVAPTLRLIWVAMVLTGMCKTSAAQKTTYTIKIKNEMCTERTLNLMGEVPTVTNGVLEGHILKSMRIGKNEYVTLEVDASYHLAAQRQGGGVSTATVRDTVIAAIPVSVSTGGNSYTEMSVVSGTGNPSLLDAYLNVDVAAGSLAMRIGPYECTDNEFRAGLAVEVDGTPKFAASKVVAPGEILTITPIAVYWLGLTDHTEDAVAMYDEVATIWDKCDFTGSLDPCVVTLTSYGKVNAGSRTASAYEL